MTFTIDANFEQPDPVELAAAWQLDPLDDEVGDYLVLGRVNVVRIACVAAETGARFQRDGISQCPMDWMLSPSELFDGLPPIEACKHKDACSRAILVHGLGLPADVHPATLSSIMSDNGLVSDALEKGWLP